MHLANAKSVIAWAAFALLLPLALRANAAGKLDWVMRGRARTVLAALCAVVVLHELAQALLYASHSFPYEPYEAAIVAVAAAFRHGQPIYPGPAEPLWYVQISYGPVIYVLHRLSLDLFGPSIAACKLPGLLSFVTTLALTLRTYRARSRGSWLPALGACAVLVLAVGRQTHMAYSMRTDPEIVTCAAAWVWALEDRTPPLALRALVCGLASGLAVNFKFTSVLYFLPMLTLALFEIPIRYVLFGALVAVGTAAAPFFLPHVSIANYLYWLGTLKAQGIEWSLVPLNFFWALHVVMPLAFAAYVLRGRIDLDAVKSLDLARLRPYAYAASLGLVVLVLVVVSSKPGATIHHVAPLAPAFIQAFARALSAAERTGVLTTVALVFGVSLLCSQLPSRVRDWPFELTMPHLGRALEAELGDVLRRYSGHRIEMTPAASTLPDRGHMRAVLVAAGQRYVLDPGTLSDLPTTGVWRMPPAILSRIEQCADDVEVVPRDGVPYGVFSYYGAWKLFPDAHRDAFRANYALTERLTYYDVYTCTHEPSAGRSP